MDTFVSAIIYITAIGLVCATLLSVLGKIMFVKVDERVQAIRNVMPGANCGACGYSGCDGYAAALVSDGVAANLCPPGGNDLVGQISDIMGIGVGDSVAKKIAIVHCMGETGVMRNKMDYSGIKTCLAAKQLFGGQSACTFGCLGHGDCVASCPSDAICMEKGLARVDTRNCTGCGLCVKACPNDIISIEVDTIAVAVMCKNTEKGAALKDKCSKGCIGCMKCAKECHAQAITVKDFLGVIDYSKCDGCGKCAEVCIKGCIVAR